MEITDDSINGTYTVPFLSSGGGFTTWLLNIPDPGLITYNRYGDDPESCDCTGTPFEDHTSDSNIVVTCVSDESTGCALGIYVDVFLVGFDFFSFHGYSAATSFPITFENLGGCGDILSDSCYGGTEWLTEDGSVTVTGL